jgi:hypothetical protein
LGARFGSSILLLPGDGGGKGITCPAANWTVTSEKDVTKT